MRILEGIILTGLVLFLMGAFDPCYQRTTIEHVVKPNETFWSVAGKYFDEQDRYPFGEFVYVIRDANGGIRKQVIQPGEILIIPLDKK